MKRKSEQLLPRHKRSRLPLTDRPPPHRGPDDWGRLQWSSRLRKDVGLLLPILADEQVSIFSRIQIEGFHELLMHIRLRNFLVEGFCIPSRITTLHPAPLPARVQSTTNATRHQDSADTARSLKCESLSAELKMRWAMNFPKCLACVLCACGVLNVNVMVISALHQKRRISKFLRFGPWQTWHNIVELKSPIRIPRNLRMTSQPRVFDYDF